MTNKLKFMCKLVVLVMICFFTGCSQTVNNNEDFQMGRYIEQTINNDILKQAGMFFCLNANGTVQVYQLRRGELFIYELQANSIWQQVEKEWIKEFCEKYRTENGQVRCMATNEKGEPYIVVDTEEATKVFYVQENVLKEVILKPDSDYSVIIPTYVTVVNDNEIILSGEYAGQVLFDLTTGNEIKKFSNPGTGNGMVAYKDKMAYMLNVDKGQIDVYNMESYQLQDSIKCHKVEKDSIVLLGDNDSIYLVDKQGINQFLADTKNWGEVVGGEGTSLSFEKYQLKAAVQKDGDFFVLQEDNDGNVMLRQYTYSEDVATKTTVELNAYTLEENKILEELILNYEIEHPEVKINLQVGLESSDGISKNEAINAFNTEILAGEGADLIVLDGLSTETYMQKGVLADLSSLEGVDSIFPFALDVFKEEDKVYAIPTRMRIPVIWGPSDSVNALQDLIKFNEDQRKNFTTMMSKDNRFSLISKYAGVYQEKWFNQNGELQVDELSNFLRAIKEISLSEEDEETSIINGINYVGIRDFAFKKTDVYMDYIKNIRSLMIGNTCSEYRNDSTVALLTADGKKYCEVCGVIGINENSLYKDAATQFIEYVLSEKGQLVETNEGFPIVKSAFESYMKGQTLGEIGDCLTIRSEDLKEKIYINWGNVEWGYSKPLDKYIKDLEPFVGMVEQIETVKMSDQIVVELILKGVEPYFNNEKTVEEVVAELKPKLELYKQEG